MSDIEELRQAVIDAANHCELHARYDGHAELIEALSALREAETAGEPLIWVERTWRDVRPGDMVRMPGVPATASMVESAAIQARHVDPRSNTYRPIALEHEVMRVRLAAWPEGREINPDAAVEIATTVAELAAIELLGWPNRIRVEHGEQR